MTRPWCGQCLKDNTICKYPVKASGSGFACAKLSGIDNELLLFERDLSLDEEK